MAQGNYDHPSYLTRQQIGLGVSTAGANGSSGGKFFVSDMRFRKLACTVKVAGTSSGAGNSANIMVVGTYMTGFSTGLIGTALTTTTGTNTVATFALGSATALSTFTSTDLDIRLVAGSLMFYKNGTDNTGTFDVTAEAYLDPGATWTGPPGN